MGEAKSKKKRFLEANPLCCYCGGNTSATTSDHQPARTFFRQRHWPEHFEFPACEPCNQASRETENLLGVVILPNGAEGDPSIVANFQWVHRNYPGVLEKIASMDTRAKRRAMNEAGVRPPVGESFAEQPLMRIEMSFWKPHLDMFARKMLLSLFYQSFNVPLSPSGVMVHMYETNFEVMKNGDLPALAKLVPTLVMPKRSNVVLADQFSIRYATDRDTKTALYVLNFHGSLFLSGVISETAQILKKTAPPQAQFQTCFSHD